MPERHRNFVGQKIKKASELNSNQYIRFHTPRTLEILRAEEIGNEIISSLHFTDLTSWLVTLMDNTVWNVEHKPSKYKKFSLDVFDFNRVCIYYFFYTEIIVVLNLNIYTFSSHFHITFFILSM